MIVHTESGSVYHVAPASRTWTRLVKTERSGRAPAESGRFDEIGLIKIGMPLRFRIESDKPELSGQYITTTPVVKLEEK